MNPTSASIPMRKTVKETFLLIGLASFVLGAIGSQMPWGRSDGLHGTGFPVPGVLWDKANRYSDSRNAPPDQFLDFPNPLGAFENMLLFFLVLTVLWGMIAGVRRLIRGRRHA